MPVASSVHTSALSRRVLSVLHFPHSALPAGLAMFLFFRSKGLLYYALQLALQNFTYLVGSTQLMDLYPVRLSFLERCPLTRACSKSAQVDANSNHTS